MTICPSCESEPCLCWAIVPCAICGKDIEECSGDCGARACPGCQGGDMCFCLAREMEFGE